MNRQQIISNILENMNTVKRSVYSRLQANGKGPALSPSQLELLFAIKHSQPVNTKQLAEKLHVTPGAISQSSETLEIMALIERKTQSDDRRRQTLFLTPAGESAFETIQSERQAIYLHIMEDMSDDELLLWQRVQHKIIAHVGNATDPKAISKQQQE